MVKVKVVLSRELKGLRPIILYGEPIFSRYEKISTCLKHYLNDDVAELFSIPDISLQSIKKGGEVSWLSEKVQNAQCITSLSIKDKRKALQVLEKKVQSVLELSQELIESDDTSVAQLGEILACAIEIPDESHIYVSGDQVVLVAWGFLLDEVDVSTRFRLRNATISVAKGKNHDVNDSETVEQSISGRRKKWLGLFVISALVVVCAALVLLNFYKKENPSGDLVGSASNDASLLQGDLLKRKINVTRLTVGVATNKSNVVIGYLQDVDDVNILSYNEDFDILQLDVLDETKLSDLKEVIEKIDGVNYVLYDFVYQSNAKYNDPGLNSMDAYWLDLIDARKAWTITEGNEKISIAVIDIGFDISHPELVKKYRDPWNVLSNSNKLAVPDSQESHGTHVSALALAEAGNAKGLAGVCPRCTLIPIQVGDQTGITISSILAALSYAVRVEADVINLSLGASSGLDITSLNPNERLQLLDLITKTTSKERIMWRDVFKKVTEKGSRIVIAAGNDNQHMLFDSLKSSKDTILVTAVDKNSQKATFSNYYNNAKSLVDQTLSAPGVKINSAVNGGGYGFLDGTSMAAPMVSGAIGLLLSLDSSLTTEQLRKILLQTGKSVQNLEGKAVGPVIQLYKAASEVQRLSGCDSADVCKAETEKLREKIRDLEAELEKRKKKGPALVIPDVLTNEFAFAEGKWIASNNLVRDSDNTPVKLLFEFKRAGEGYLSLVEENGAVCKAKIKLGLKRKELVITQLENASCSDKKSAYSKYNFTCKPESIGSRVAHCTATSLGKSKLVEFTLHKES